MSQFSNQLTACIERHSLTQTTVSERADISVPQLSRYVNGENRPPPEVLEKIAGVFPRDDRTALLAAYLDDDIPSALRNLLTITPKNATAARISEDSPVYRSRMPRELREAWEGVGAAALREPEHAAMLISHWNLIKPK